MSSRFAFPLLMFALNVRFPISRFGAFSVRTVPSSLVFIILKAVISIGSDCAFVVVSGAFWVFEVLGVGVGVSDVRLMWSSSAVPVI